MFIIIQDILLTNSSIYRLTSKLLSFLRVSRDYDVNAVLSRLRESVLMEEWAVAEAKAGHHGNALT